MRFKPFYWVGALALITMVLYSCQKDEVTDPVLNPTIPENPTEIFDEPEMTITVGETPNDGTTTGLSIGVKEAKEVMKVKAILKDIFKETFMQLIINHDFNPAFPALEYRTPCSCGTVIDCGCPAQTPSTGTAPATVTLTYMDPTCTACTLASGRVISGSIIIDFSAPFTDPNHVITIMPQPGFTIDGYGVTATDITLNYAGFTFPNAAGLDESFYAFQSINGLTVTDPSGATTTVGNTTFPTFTGSPPFSYISIADVGANHGSINNAFGLLDDIFTIDIIESDALTVTCSNGEEIMEYTSQPIVYDMACSCIQDGSVVMMDENSVGVDVPIMTYHYGYNGSVDVLTGDPVPCIADPSACPGECDDFILLETHCATLHDPNSATTRTTCDYESIDCL